MEERPQKRNIQRKYNKILTDLIKVYPALSGTIFTLPGFWSPKKYLNNFLESGIAIKIMAAEHDDKLWTENASTVAMINQNPAIDFVQNDIYDLMTLAFDKFQTSIPYRGADLDLCSTFSEKTYVRTTEILDDFMSSDIPIFWLRLTTSFRGCGNDETKRNLARLKNFVHEHRYCQVLDWSTETYNDKGPMMTTQLVVSKVPKSVQKTYAELSAEERTMVSTLLDDLDTCKTVKMNPGFTEEDILIRFCLRRSSLAALKAHNTMRKGRR